MGICQDAVEHIVIDLHILGITDLWGRHDGCGSTLLPLLPSSFFPGPGYEVFLSFIRDTTYYYRQIQEF